MYDGTEQTFYVQEARAPIGYKLDSKIYSQSVKMSEEYSDDTNPELAVQDVPYASMPEYGYVKIDKTDADTKKGITGAVFEIRAHQDIQVTDSDVIKQGEVVERYLTEQAGYSAPETPKNDAIRSGHIVSGPLPLGKDGTADYDIVETKAPNGYVLDSTPHTVHITKDDATYDAPKEVPISNAPAKANEKYGFIVKKVSDTPSDGISMSGTTMGVYGSEADATAGRNAIATLIVGTDGYARSDLAYDKGQTVYVKETKAVEGYDVDETVHKVTITGNGTDTAPDLTITNKKQKPKPRYGKIRIVKTDASDSSPLAGATFDIVARDDIDPGDGSPKIVKGTTVQQGLVSGTDGTVTSKELPLNSDGSGKYSIQEIHPPVPYVSNAEIYDAIFNASTDTETRTLNIPVENTPMSERIRIHKRDKQTGIGIQGVKFDVIAMEDIVRNGKTLATAGQTMQSGLTTDADGNAESGDLPIGNDGKGWYKLTETFAPEPYIIETADTYTLVENVTAGDSTESIKYFDANITNSKKPEQNDNTNGNANDNHNENINTNTNVNVNEHKNENVNANENENENVLTNANISTNVNVPGNVSTDENGNVNVMSNNAAASATNQSDVANDHLAQTGDGTFTRAISGILAVMLGSIGAALMVRRR